ncbi:Pycsar system effector family protein [Burkholderia pseudomultivorans]|uniref:Pycsar system effector family protein n=1 Tax=Burkholderia pseudomultivorans TaxID=1207504 RepID=UPI0012DA7E99|nr:Pycsar system effector family protein [Burkholderia pseudomultivorans]
MADEKNHSDQQKLLFEIIKRYDLYINTTNTKTAIILSYCMAFIGGLGFKLVDLVEKREHDILWTALLVVSSASLLITLASAHFAYKALMPQTPSGVAAHESPSVIFFGDVASHAGGRDGYYQKLTNLSIEEVNKDLAYQAFILAKIASTKFQSLNKSIRILAFYQIVAFAAVLCLLVAGTPAKSTAPNKLSSNATSVRDQHGQ